LPTTTLLDIVDIARKDENRLVRAAAIDALAKTKDKNYIPLYLEAVHDSSYSVAGAALKAIDSVDQAKAIALLPELKKDCRGRLKEVFKSLEILTKGDNDFDEVTKDFTDMPDGQRKFNLLKGYIDFLGRLSKTTNFKKGIDVVVDFRDRLAKYGVVPIINKLLNEMGKKKMDSGKERGISSNDLDEQLAYIKEKTKE